MDNRDLKIIYHPDVFNTSLHHRIIASSHHRIIASSHHPIVNNLDDELLITHQKTPRKISDICHPEKFIEDSL